MVFMIRTHTHTHDIMVDVVACSLCCVHGLNTCVCMCVCACRYVYVLLSV